MILTCVLFSLETNSYISTTALDQNNHYTGIVEFVKDYREALHFESRTQAVQFLEVYERELAEYQVDFTPREYYILRKKPKRE